jgi:hypothetical protein
MTQTSIATDEKGIQTEKHDYYIYTVNKGRALKKSIAPGLFSGGFMELAQGANFGDSIIVAGQNILKDGDSVRVVSKAGR